MGERPILSRTLNVVGLPADGVELRIVADGDTQAALAASLGLLGISSFAAELTVAKWKGEGAHVTGRVRATITQRCVVSLVPVEQEVDEAIDLRLVPEGSRLAARMPAPGAEIVVDATSEDPPEVFSGRTVDIGAIVAEHFALGIDPYPRAPGAAIPEGYAPDETGPVAADSPFAALDKLRREPGS